jgi:hypothetical protein
MRERPAADGARVTFGLVPLQQGLTGALRRPLLILWAAVGAVLLVASVNLAGLLLAQASARTRRLRPVSPSEAVCRRRKSAADRKPVLGLIGGGAILVGHVALEGLRYLAEVPMTSGSRSPRRACDRHWPRAVVRCGDRLWLAPAARLQVNVQLLAAIGTRAVAGPRAAGFDRCWLSHRSRSGSSSWWPRPCWCEPSLT